MGAGLVLVLAYALLGGLSLWAAAPLGFASPVFPAAGLALAAALSYGWRMLPAVWLGSVVLNGATAYLTHGVDAAEIVAVGIVGLGATLQAAAGGWLILRFVGAKWIRLEEDTHVIFFVVLGGLVSGLVSASVGATALVSFGLTERALWLDTWWTWYVGDVIGIIVFTPLAYSIMDFGHPARSARLWRFLGPTIVTLGIAVALFTSASNWERQNRESHLRTDAASISGAISDRLSAQREVLASLQRFVVAMPDYSYEQFESFTRITLAGNPDIRALSINDLVTDEGRAAYERDIASKLPMAGFEIKEAGANGKLVRAARRPIYVPVRYIVPLSANRPAVGFDINSEPIRRDAIERALSSRETAVTSPVRLVQDQSTVTGILALMPIMGGPRLNAEGVPIGFAVAVLKIEQMIVIATREHRVPGLEFYLLDLSAPPEHRLVYHSEHQVPAGEPEPATRAAWSTTLQMADHQWRLEMVPNSSYRADDRPFRTWLVGAAVLFFCTLLHLFMLGVTGHAAAIQRKNDALAKSDLAKQRALQNAEFLASHDQLTKLPNHMLGTSRIEQALGHAKRHSTAVAVLYVDVDRFKYVNDTHGHEAGNKLLVAIAKRLGPCLRADDTLCRLFGDEFLIILSDVDGQNGVAKVCERIRDEMAVPFDLGNAQLNSSLSIGIAMYPQDGTDHETLLRNADTALYDVKQGGRNGYRFYSEEMNRKAERYIRLRSELQQALDQQEFELYFQPQVSLKTGAVVGVEALVRWNHPKHGLKLPGAFIEIAEESGLIVPIGTWVLQQACRQAAEWRANGFPDLVVGVNLSAVQFRNGSIEAAVVAALKDSGLAPQGLMLELTESVLIEDSAVILATIDQIKAHGIKLAFDDFGTGYSSLSYIKRFHADKLKIDRSFVSDIAADRDDLAIVRAIIGMAHSLGIDTIAEGVEDNAALDMLIELGCDMAQGFHFARPMPAKDFVPWARAFRYTPGEQRVQQTPAD